MDAPDMNFDDMVTMAEDRKQWRAYVISKFGKCKRKKRNRRALTIRWQGGDGTVTTTTIAAPKTIATIKVTAMKPKVTATKPKLTLSAKAPSFIPQLQLKQAKIKKKKSKPRPMTYKEKLREHNSYLDEHHGQYRRAIEAVFDSDSSADYSGHCSFVCLLTVTAFIALCITPTASCKTLYQRNTTQRK